jgi:hypothetical protein
MEDRVHLAGQEVPRLLRQTKARLS